MPKTAGTATVATCTARALVSLHPSNSEFEPRQNQVDWRIGSSIRMGNIRVEPRFEIYNLFNASDVQALSSRYTPGANNTWLNAAGVLTARLFKFAVQVDW